MEELTIQTHSGRFHADEVAAVSLLTSFYTHRGHKVSLIRSRDKEDFERSDILVDVGFEYDPDRFRFDHHQPNFQETWENSEIPLSSVGLIWRHYGKQIVTMYICEIHGLENNNEIKTLVNDITNEIYFKLIVELDANDNGIVYNSNNLNIPEIVGSLNGDASNEISQDEKFNRAVRLVGEIFDIKFQNIINNYMNYSNDLKKIEKMELKPYLILEENIPTIVKCLNKVDPDYIVKFLIIKDGEQYKIGTRRRKGEKFATICPIAKEEFLKNTVETPEDIIFVHKALFIAKSKTLKTAEEIVLCSLNVNKNRIYIPLHRASKYRKSIITGVTIAAVGVLSYFYFKE